MSESIISGETKKFQMILEDERIKELTSQLPSAIHYGRFEILKLILKDKRLNLSKLDQSGFVCFFFFFNGWSFWWPRQLPRYSSKIFGLLLDDGRFEMTEKNILKLCQQCTLNAKLLTMMFTHKTSKFEDETFNSYFLAVCCDKYPSLDSIKWFLSKEKLDPSDGRSNRAFWWMNSAPGKILLARDRFFLFLFLFHFEFS